MTELTVIHFSPLKPTNLYESWIFSIKFPHDSIISGMSRLLPKRETAHFSSTTYTTLISFFFIEFWASF